MYNKKDMEAKDISHFMDLAYKEALLAYSEKETPIGAVLIDENNNVISSSHNHSLLNIDPTLHAEMNVMKEGFMKLKTKNLSSCSIFITLEPCPMCLGGMINAHLKNIYFGSLDPKRGAFSFYNMKMDLDNMNIHYLNDKRCGELLTSFFKEIRKRGD